MKAFRFRLQKILDLRNLQEHEARKGVAFALCSLQAEEDCLRELASSQREVLADLQGALVHAASAPLEVSMRLTELGLVESHQQATMKRRQAAENRLESARLEAIKKKTDAEIMRRLRERHREQHVQEQRREEEKWLDEVASGRHQNRLKEGETP